MCWNWRLPLTDSDAILRRLMALHPKVIDLSLGRIKTLLKRLGNPERNLPLTIHVAGTNGKGSVIAFLRAILEAAGHRVHVYTSPHLVHFNERIRLAGKLILFAHFFERFRGLAVPCFGANSSLLYCI